MAASDLTTVARGGLLNLAGVLTNAVAGFVLVVVVTRGLGATGAGLFFESVALFSILGAIAQWGADVGVIRAIPHHRVGGRSADVARTIWAGILPAAALGGVLAILLYSFAPRLGGLLTNGAHGADLAPALRVLAPFLPVYAVYMVGLAATRGFGTMLPSTVVDKLGRAILQPAFVALAIGLGLSGLGIVTAWAAPFGLGLVAVLAWTALLLRRARRRTSGPQAPDRTFGAVVREFWRFAGPRGLASVFSVAVVWLSTLLIGALRSPAEAATYAAATRFLVFGQFIGVAISQVVAPKLSELLAIDDRERARSVFATATWWLIALAWPLYVTMIVQAPSLLSAFGPSYQRGQAVLVILGTAMLVATAVGPVDIVLLMAGRSSWNLLNTLIAVIANVILNLVLIPRYGLEGAAIAWAVSILLNNLLPLVEVWAIVRLQPFGVGTLVSGLSAALTFGGFGLSARVLLGHGLAPLLAAGAAASLLHALVLWHYRERLHLDALRMALRRNDSLADRAPFRLNARYRTLTGRSEE